ncbi:MAG: Heavy-metal-associated domain protein [Acidobacteria bacterium]|nr:Heavy-metal-associated domain protein [Acidobacteriota bacterium]
MRHPLAATLLVAAICILWPAPSFAQIEEVRIGVDGLTCNLCAAGLERSLRKLDSVSSVRIALADDMAHVTLKAGAAFDPETFRAAVTNAGQRTRHVELRLSGAVERQDGRYSLRPGAGSSLAVGASSAAKLEPYVGKVVRVHARVSSPARSPWELDLTDVAVR